MYRKLTWPAHLQGIAMGLIVGFMASGYGDIAMYAVLAMALFLASFSYVREKQIRSVHTDTEGDR